MCTLVCAGDFRAQFDTQHRLAIIFGQAVLYVCGTVFHYATSANIIAALLKGLTIVSGPQMVLRMVALSDVASILAHFPKILFDSVLAVFEGLLGWWTSALKWKQKNQSAKEKRHAADHQRDTNGAHLKNPKSDRLIAVWIDANIMAPISGSIPIGRVPPSDVRPSEFDYRRGVTADESI
jgi:hypothetical protein